MNIHPLQQSFNLLYKEMNDLYHEFAVSMHLSDSAQMVLYTICELGDGCLQKDICDRCFLTKQTVHSAVRKLEQEGILTLSAGKGRDMHLSLTEKGQTLVQQSVFPLAEAEYRTMEILSPQEQADMLRLTQKYVSALRRELQQITID
jgi:DNA-binding MarR family transcriptional regulator